MTTASQWLQLISTFDLLTTPWQIFLTAQEWKLFWGMSTISTLGQQELWNSNTWLFEAPQDLFTTWLLLSYSTTGLLKKSNSLKGNMLIYKNMKSSVMIRLAALKSTKACLLFLSSNDFTLKTSSPLKLKISQYSKVMCLIISSLFALKDLDSTLSPIVRFIASNNKWRGPTWAQCFA